MKTVLFITLIFSCSLRLAFTQDNETLAKSTFVSASKAYNNGEYKKCLLLLDKTEELMGSSQQVILHLRAKSNYNLKLYSKTKKDIVEFFDLNPDENTHHYKEILELLTELNMIDLEKEKLFNKIKKDRDFSSAELFLKRYPNSYLSDYEEILPVMCELSLLELSNLEQSKHYADLYIDACNKNLIPGSYRNKVQQLIDKRVSMKKDVAEKWSGNISVSEFSNGDQILYAASPKEWAKAGWNSVPAWTYYNYNKDNEEYYGKLYNYFAVTDERNLCPSGSHVSTLQDWRKLITTIITYNDNNKVLNNTYRNDELREWSHGNVANYLKSSVYWQTKGASNTYGFSAVPGGYLQAKIRKMIALGYGQSEISFKEMGLTGMWWIYSETVDEYDLYGSIYIEINDQDQSIHEKNGAMWDGRSVRCVKNEN